jgi:hypothetical protein
VTTLLQAVERLSGVERQLAEVYALLIERWKRQQLTPADVGVYDRLRFGLYSAEMECFGKYAMQGRRVALAVGADWAAAQIPIPKCARPFPLPVNDPKFVGLRGLGAGPAILAVPAISLTGWALILLASAAVVVLLLGAMVVTAGLTYYLASLVDDYAQTLDYYNTVERVLQDCIASGRTSEECLRLAGGISPPKGERPMDATTVMLVGGVLMGLGVLIFVVGVSGRGRDSGGGGTIVLRGS